MSKITIYLDNDDYSKLSNPVELQRNPSFVSTLDKLKEYLDQGIIEIRYSALNIVELVHLDDNSKPYAIARAKLLKELTRTKAFVRPDMLHLQEAILFGSGSASKDKLSFAYAKPDDWTGLGEQASTFDAEKTLRERFQQSLIKNGLPRNMRRQFEKTFLTKEGKLTPNAVKTLLPHWESTEKERHFPLFEQVMIDYCAGRGAKQTLDESLLSVLSDVEILVTKVLDFSPNTRDTLIQFIRNLSNPMEATILNVQNRLNELEREWPTSITDKDFAKWVSQNIRSNLFQAAGNARARALAKMYEDNIEVINKSGIRQHDWQKRVVESQIGQLPALDTLILLATYVSYDRLMDRKELDANDLRDFFHATYAPYCHIFRADKRTASLLDKVRSRIPALQSTIVVKNPAQIVTAIEEELSQKQFQAAQ